MSNQNQDVTMEKMTFEQAYNKLEETVRKLEAGNLALADALALYEQGMDLAKHCGRQLDQAELSIKSLTPSGELVDINEIA